jgi:hypothetical protein
VTLSSSDYPSPRLLSHNGTIPGDFQLPLVADPPGTFPNGNRPRINHMRIKVLPKRSDPAPLLLTAAQRGGEAILTQTAPAGGPTLALLRHPNADCTAVATLERRLP